MKIMKGKKVLITGGLGFIGSNLATECVKLGAEVTIFDCLDPRSGGNSYNVKNIIDSVQVFYHNILDFDQVSKVVLEKDIIYPDLAIFLQADTDRLMTNIKKRGREYESSIDADYIDSLNQVYNEYFFRYDKGPLLIINTNDIDFVNNEEDLNGIMNFLKEPIKGRKYYNPTKLF